MAFQSVWYHTELPEQVIDTIVEDLTKYNDNMQQSQVMGGVVNLEKRDSRNAWIPTASWIGGFCMHYVLRANRENFLYDIEGIDGENIQYTEYGPGQYYGWHTDQSLSGHFKPMATKESVPNDFVMSESEKVRKLSFSLQLSSHEDYDGGEFQLMNDAGATYFAPKRKGTFIIFDSRANHRVKPVRSGVRRSLVGWVLGPRWK